MQRVFSVLFLIGFALLPLSNQARDQTWSVIWSVDIPFIDGLYSPGLIVLWLAAGIGFFVWIQAGAPTTSSERAQIGLAVTFVGLIVCLLAVVPDVKASGIRASSHILGLVLFSLLLTTRRQRPDRLAWDRNLGLLGLTLGGAVLSVYYLLNTFVQTSFTSLDSIIYSRFTGGVNSLSWGASNIVASVLLVSACASVLLFNDGSRKSLVAICIISAGIMATLSRNSVTCLLLIVTIYSLILGQRKVLWISGFLTLFVGAGEFLRRENLLDDIVQTRTGDIGNVVSVGGRQEIWDHYLGQIYERPLGFNGFYSGLSEFGFSPHNWFLTTYWELGSLGVLAGFALVAYPLIKVRRETRSGDVPTRRAGLLAVCLGVVVFLNLQSEDPQFSHQYIVFWWVWLASLSTGISTGASRNGGSAHRRTLILPRSNRCMR